MQPSPFSANNNKGRFLSQEQLAEIRNALAIILGNAQLLEREPGITPDQKKKLETIVTQTHRIAGSLKSNSGVGERLRKAHREVQKEAQKITDILDKSMKLLHGAAKDIEGALKDLRKGR